MRMKSGPTFSRLRRTASTGKAHPLGIGPAPGVGALVGALHQELVDEVPLRAHDLHAVVAGIPGQGGAVGEVVQGALHPPGRQRARLEATDRRLAGGGSHRQRGVGVAPRVEDLHRDAPTLGVHGVGHLAMQPHRQRPRELAGHRLDLARPVGGDAPGHHQPHPAPGPPREVGGQLLEREEVVLKAHVHRAHQDPVGQGDVPQVQGREQVGIAGMGGGRHGDSGEEATFGAFRPGGKPGGATHLRAATAWAACSWSDSSS